MKNLENFGVQELNSKEMENVNGGSFWSFLGGVLILALLLIASNNPSRFNVG